MKPLAPTFRAEKAYSSRSKVVRISTFGGSVRAQMRRVASTPSILGMRTSIRTTSTAVAATTSSASAPSPASATTSMSGLRRQHHAEAGAQQHLVVDEHHADRHAGYLSIVMCRNVRRMLRNSTQEINGPA
ncbi:hypothetical protein GCM10020000_36540 [Streptomyces olivoverticillatus]